jgi:hypothetical protein
LARLATRVRLSACLIVVVWLCASCSRSELSTTPLVTATNVETEPSFQMYILEQDWMNWPELGNTFESAWPLLMEVDLAESSIWLIAESDIELYEWSQHQQTLYLTEQATGELREAFSDEELLSWSMRKKVFVVTVDGERLYGGVFIEVGSAAGFEFPVVHTVYSDNRLAFRLRSGYFALVEPSALDSQEVQDLFRELGKLVEGQIEFP